MVFLTLSLHNISETREKQLRYTFLVEDIPMPAKVDGEAFFTIIIKFSHFESDIIINDIQFVHNERKMILMAGGNAL